MFAYIMCGPIGSGKSHVAKTLYGHLPQLNPDDLMPKGEWTREKSNAAWDEIHRRIEAMVGIGLEFVVDSAQALQVSRRRLTQYIRQVAPSYKIVCVFVNTPYKKCARNNRLRDRVVPEDKLKEYYDNVMNSPPSRDDGYDEVIVVNNALYSGNYGEVWKSEKPWPEGWYHV